MPISRLQTAQKIPNGGSLSISSRSESGINSVDLSLSLRIIYTLNSSSQPLLARLRQKTLVTPVLDIEISDNITKKPLFGKVLLKTCLAAVCSSSPELLGNPERDYSIYIVDPLETISGLSVGAGLLSWWLKNDRPPVCHDEDNSNEYAIGKIVKDRGVESLEIMMSLKETTPQSAEDYAKSLSCLRLPLFQQIHHESTHESPDTPSGENKNPKHCKVSNKTRLGRPAGATTNPEKKARRAALLEQKETLKKLQNLAKMQRGEPYDCTLITSNDLNALKVTEDDIIRQQKIVDDLESRPAISRQRSSFLTTKPLPSRTATPSISATALKSDESSSSASNTSTTNDKPSGLSFTSQASTAASGSRSSTTVALDPGVIPNAEILQSLLISLLGKIDISLTKPSVKGKETEAATNIDPTLLVSLRHFLPLLSNSSALPPHCGPTHMPSLMPHSIPQKPHVWNVPVPGLMSSVSKRLFQTADETFHSSDHPSSELTEHAPNRANHYSFAKSDPPKVREDAHPVPGGGWARGRNLIPRALSTTLSDRQSGQQSMHTSPSPSADTELDKENKPLSNLSRNIKRGSAASQDKENLSDIPKHNTKKRKIESRSSYGEDAKTTGTQKTGLTTINAIDNTANVISRVASRPLRSSNSRIRTLSRSDSQDPSAPLVASADFPIPEPPRTPPRKDTTTNLDERSLFTPATPAHPSGIYTGASLFTPSPVWARTQDKSTVGSILHSAAIDSEPFTMKPGWDLPPSSPPPLTSPILPPADLTVRDRLELTSHITPKGTPQDMDKIGLRQVPSPAVIFPSSALSSDFEELSEGDMGEALEPALTDDLELDIDELWNSLGPIIIQAQIDNPGLVDPSIDSFNSDCSVSHVVPESQNGIDAAKLSEDLKALFGGCVV